MKNFVLALGFGALTAAATPLLAGSTAFQPVAPDGLDAKATEFVEALQAVMPEQIPAFEENGFVAWGAMAVPKGMALDPQSMTAVASYNSQKEAEAGVLEACKAQFKADCTVIGLLVPAN